MVAAVTDAIWHYVHSDPSVQERRSSREASRRCSYQRPAQGYYRGIKLIKTC